MGPSGLRSLCELEEILHDGLALALVSASDALFEII